MINYDNERREDISENSNSESDPLSAKSDRMINSDSLAQSQDVNECSAPLNAEE